MLSEAPIKLAGYDLPSPLAEGWEPIGTPCYLSVSGQPAAAQSNGAAPPRNTEWAAATLTIQLPAGNAARFIHNGAALTVA